MKKVYVGQPIENNQKEYKITMGYEEKVKVGNNSYPKIEAEEMVKNLSRIFTDLTIDLVEVEQ